MWQLFYKIKRYIFGNPVWSTMGETPVVFAFTFEGVDYFTFSNIYSMPYQRSFCAISIYEEMQMRITKEYLNEWILAMKDQINNNEIKLTSIAELLYLLEERTNWAVDIESYLKLASIIYFTKEESPFVYDISYNKGKIERWKNSKDILSFFLQRPLRELMPLSETSPEVIQSYLVGSLTRNVETLEHLQRLWRMKDIESDRKKWLNYQITRSQQLISNLLRSTSTASSSDQYKKEPEKQENMQAQ